MIPRQPCNKIPAMKVHKEDWCLLHMTTEVREGRHLGHGRCQRTHPNSKAMTTSTLRRKGDLHMRI